MTRAEPFAPVVYFAGYLAYLFAHPESDLLHWGTLVVGPLTLLALLRRGGARRPSALLASVGLRRGNLHTALGWAVLVGLAISVLQLGVSQRAAAILPIVTSGRVLWLFPLTVLLLLLTAGFTEEFFFRGVLQTRLECLLGSRWLGLSATSLLFGLYHLPYAYLNPSWPSAGSWGAAWIAALGQGIPAGLVLGGIYIASRRNLFASVVTHTLINALPAMTMIRLGTAT